MDENVWSEYHILRNDRNEENIMVMYGQYIREVSTSIPKADTLSYHITTFPCMREKLLLYQEIATRKYKEWDASVRTLLFKQLYVMTNQPVSMCNSHYYKEDFSNCSTG